MFCKYNSAYTNLNNDIKKYKDFKGIIAKEVLASVQKQVNFVKEKI